MSDKFTIELDEDFLEQLYGLVGELPPSKEMANLDDFKRVFAEFNSLNSPTIREEDTFGSFVNEQEQKKVLIVDDLGTITYQLGVLLGKHAFLPVSSQEIYDAIAKFKKQHFDIVLLDLYIPTEREGFLLLDEIIKINEFKPNKSIIGIMTASNKREHKLACKERGADFYVEKIEDWQKNIIEMCTRYQNKI